MTLPQLLVTAGTLYLEVGLAVALVFAGVLVGRVEPSARGGSILFRVVIVPAAALLWPLIVVRSLRVLSRTRGAS
jgi:hypothetical protein